MIYPKAERDTTILYLTWKVTLSRVYPLQEIIYFVDAQSGEIIEQKNNIVEDGFSGQVTGSYWPVHNYDQTVQAPFKTTHIKVYNYLGQMVADVNTDDNGNYSTGSFAYSYYYIQFPIQNEWVQARDALNNGATIVQNRGPYLPGTIVNANFGASDGTSVRWLASAIHDYLKNTFSYTAMDYQMGAYVNEGTGRNGAADGMNIYFGSQSGQYWARSSDVVYHEYTHNTIYHIYGGWIGDPNQYYIQATAMDEGFADYFACTMNNDPILGEDVGVGRNLDNNTYTWNPNAGAHWNGQVIGGACWDLRQSVGQSIADNLVFKALQVSPHARTFSDFEYNVFVVDNNYYNHSHTSQITQAFASHGITVPVLSASISGPTYLNGNQVGTYTCSASGGISLYSYQWWKLDIGSSSPATLFSISPNRPPVNTWYQIGTNSPTVSTSNPVGLDFELKCVVTDAANNNKTSNIIYVTVGGSAKIAAGDPLQSKAVSQDVLTEYALTQNFPNPFNPTTTIRFSLPEASFVTLKVFDMLGREITELISEVKSSGEYEVEFDGTGLPSGTYIYRLTAGKYSAVGKMTLMK